MIKVMVVFGTRPEAIKMCPGVNELKRRKNIRVFTCISGQHKELLNSVINIFSVKADYNLKIMKDRQTLFDITERVLERIKRVLLEVEPDIVLVHGDTSTAFAVSLACFYMKIPVGHIEAGLRSGDVFEPYPEEFNRRSISIISKYDFAPTTCAAENLYREGKSKKFVYITGNTVIDALQTTIKENYSHPLIDWIGNKRSILVTAHRRENIGQPMVSIFKDVRRLADERRDIRIICPLHSNPDVRDVAREFLDGAINVKLCGPLEVIDFHNILAKVSFVATDSGGLQEEGIALGKPVLVLRNKTERTEGVLSGGIKLIGTCEGDVCHNLKMLLDDNDLYKKMSCSPNPYGDGKASKRIADIIEKELLGLTFVK